MEQPNKEELLDYLKRGQEDFKSNGKSQWHNAILVEFVRLLKGVKSADNVDLTDLYMQARANMDERYAVSAAYQRWKSKGLAKSEKDKAMALTYLPEIVKEFFILTQEASWPELWEMAVRKVVEKHIQPVIESDKGEGNE